MDRVPSGNEFAVMGRLVVQGLTRLRRLFVVFWALRNPI